MKTVTELAREAGWTSYDSLDERHQRFHDLAIAQYREGLLAGVGEPCSKCGGRGWYICGASDQKRKCYECVKSHPAPKAEQSEQESAIQEWPPFHECWAVRLVYFDKFGEPTMHKQVPERREQEKRISELEAQRKQLLGALKQMLALDEEDHQRYPGDEDVCQEVRAARAAISAAEQAQGAKTCQYGF